MIWRTALIDPPWPEQGGGKIKRGADRHYARAYADKVAPPDLDRLTLQAVFEEITNG